MAAMRRLRSAAVTAAALFAAIPAAAQADKLTYNDILGAWCGEVFDYNFARDRLTVTYRDERAPLVLRIRRYVFADEWVNVIFRLGGNSVFAEFALDGTSMAQQPATLGGGSPRRPFRRC